MVVRRFRRLNVLVQCGWQIKLRGERFVCKFRACALNHKHMLLCEFTRKGNAHSRGSHGNKTAAD